MPIFDGEALTITLDSGVTEVAFIDVYSAWKNWQLEKPKNRGYPPAFSPDGGNPLTTVLSQGAYFFLNNEAGWRMRPPEENITIYVTGNLAVNNIDLPALIPTLGSFTAAIFGIQPITQGVNATLGQQIEKIFGQVSREIWLDPSLGSNGNGYQQSPYNNLTDAIDDAETNGITALVLLDDITLNRNLKNFSVRGIGIPTIDLAGYDLKGCSFNKIKLQGTYLNTIQVQDCTLLTGMFLNGHFIDCALAGDLTCIDAGSVFMKDSASSIAGLGRPTISMNGVGSSKLSVRNHGGGLTIKDCNNASDEITVEMGQMGSLTFDASCTDGSMVARTNGKFVNLTTGAIVTRETFSQDIWQERGHDPSNPAAIKDDSIKAGNVDIAITDDGTTTTLTS